MLGIDTCASRVSRQYAISMPALVVNRLIEGLIRYLLTAHVLSYRCSEFVDGYLNQRSSPVGDIAAINRESKPYVVNHRLS